MLNDRQNEILAYINSHGEVRNSDIEAIGGNHSAMTLWRDLKKLEAEGKIIRIRGGAAAVRNNVKGQEIAFVNRARQNTSAKESIASIATNFILPNRAYYLDAGSTVFTLTRYLRKENFTIITAATNTATELAKYGNINLTMLGGQMNSNTLSCSGPQTEEILRDINIDIAVMSTTGFSLHSGFTNGNPQESSLKKHVIEKAAFCIMLIDHGKISRQHPFTFATIDDTDVIIGDAQMPEEFKEAVRKKKKTLFTPDDGFTASDREKIFLKLLNKKIN